MIAANLASTNRHKLAELQAVLPDWSVELVDAEALPPEDGATYYDNARAKARFGQMTGKVGVWMLGEDSGIEVEALGGGPGIHSARWSRRSVEELVERLQDVQNRAARYVCELVCLSPQDREFRGTGALGGRIATEARGSEGFGYDPIFIPEGEERTVAELGDAWKCEHSHRARAAQELLTAIGQRR